MPKFSKASMDKLKTCHPDLQKIFNTIINFQDCTILEGHRGEEAQNKAFKEGKSKLKWPNGNHNKTPSLAVDVAPFPIDLEDTGRFILFAGRVLQVADQLGIDVIWGGNWRDDGNIKNNKFNDYVHFELKQ